MCCHPGAAPGQKATGLGEEEVSPTQTAETQNAPPPPPPPQQSVQQSAPVFTKVSAQPFIQGHIGVIFRSDLGLVLVLQ